MALSRFVVASSGEVAPLTSLIALSLASSTCCFNLALSSGKIEAFSISFVLAVAASLIFWIASALASAKSLAAFFFFAASNEIP